MATKYKIGDKVILTSVDDWEEKFGLRVGMEGIIVELSYGDADVSFNGWHGGHTNKECDSWIVVLE